MREQIQLAAKLYQCQETAKSLFKGEYKEKVQPYIDLLNKLRNERKEDVLKTVIQVCKEDKIKNSGMAIMMFMAAAVEIVEPGKK